MRRYLLPVVIALFILVPVTVYAAVPDPPTNLTATTVNSTQIDLSWTAPSGSVDGYKIMNGTIWDIGNATYTNLFDTGAIKYLRDVSFKPDGTKMYVAWYTPISISEYDLSIPWNVTSASHVYSKNVATDSPPAVDGIFFKSDGTKMYSVVNADIHEWDLSSAWNITTLSHNQTIDVTSENNGNTGIVFNSDGTEMWTVGWGGDEINEYHLSNAWNITSATHIDVYNIGSYESQPQGFDINEDGTKIIVSGDGGDEVNQFTLSTPWDLTTISHDKFTSVITDTPKAYGVELHPNGHILYIANLNEEIHQYDLFTTLVADTGDTSTTYSNTGLTANTTHSYAIYTLNINGTSGTSNVDSATTFLYDDVPTAPTGLTAVQTNTTNVQLDWSAATNATSYEVDRADYSEFSVFSDEVNPTGVFMKTDGTVMYVIGWSGDDVNQYNLTSAWDITTAVYDDKFSVLTQNPFPMDIFFKSDGTKFYTIDYTDDEVNEYNMTSAWDVGSAVYHQNFSVAGEELKPSGLYFKSDGTEMWISGYEVDEINEYHLSTAWDISSASAVSVHSVTSEEPAPTGLVINSAGTKLYLVGQIDDEVNEYNMTSAWDLTTIVHNRVILDVSFDTQPQGIAFGEDESSFLLMGSGVDEVVHLKDVASLDSLGNVTTYDDNTIIPKNSYYYGVYGINNDGSGKPDSIIFGPTYGDSIEDLVATTSSNTQIDLAWSITDNGNVTGYQINRGNSTNIWDVGEAYVVNPAPVDNGNNDITSEAGAPTGIYFKSDGTKMYVVGTQHDEIHEYDLSEPWNVESKILSNSTNIFSYQPASQDIFIKPDGTKIYTIGDTDDEVNEYDLSVAWDLTTISHNQLFSVSSEETGPYGVTFSPDGVDMWISGTSGEINEYHLGTPWDISTASHIGLFSTATEDAVPLELTFNDDGTKVFVIGNTNQEIIQYSMSSAYDLTTISHDKSYDVDADDTELSTLRGLFIRDSGDFAYVFEANEDIVMEINLFPIIDSDSGSGSASYSDTGLSSGTTYYYQVTPIYEDGLGFVSNSDSDTTTSGPSAPQNPSATTISTSQIDLAWDPPSSNGGSPITGYTIYRESPVGNGFTTIVADNGNVTTYSDTSLASGTIFNYKVQAFSAVSSGVNSTAFNNSTIPVAATSLIVAATSDTQLDLSWTAPSGNDLWYKIEVESPVGGGFSTEVANQSAVVYSDTLLTSLTQYNYKVTVFNQGGSASATSEVSNYTLPNPPTSFTATPVSDTQVNLAWVAPSGSITGYKIERESPSGNGFTTLVNDTGTTDVTYSDTSLTSNTDYNYRVSAWSAQNISGTSNEDNAWTTATAPTDGNAATISSTQITLTWTAPSGSGVTGYRIYQESPTGGGFTNYVNNTGSNSTTYNDSGLTPATQYNYKVAAWNADGLGSNSTAFANYTTPQIPTSLTATQASTSSINLSWTAPSGTVTGYKIERENPIGGGFTVVTADTGSTATTYGDTGLTSDTQYNYRVSAINLGGSSTPSSTDSDYTFPDAPTSLTAVSLTATTIDLTWNAPSPSSNVNGYKIEREAPEGSGWSTLVANTSNTNVYYNDTGLSIIYYNYRVSALNPGTLPSVASNEAPISPYHLPNAVEDLVATVADFSRVLLSFTVPTDVQPIIGYQINYTTPLGDPVTIISNNTNTFLIEGLDTYDNAYSFRLAPITIHGSNATGNIANTTIFAPFEIGDLDITPSGTSADQLPIHIVTTSINSTAKLVTVTYDDTMALSCDFAYKFAKTNQTYTNLTETSTANPGEVTSDFTLINPQNEIINIQCDDTLGDDVAYHQINQDTFPFLTQTTDFQDGVFDTEGDFGAIDLITLFIIIISMIAFSRTNQAVGIGIMIIGLGAAMYFGFIQLDGLIIGVLVLLLVIAIARVRSNG